MTSPLSALGDPNAIGLRQFVLLRRFENEMDAEVTAILDRGRRRLVQILFRQDLTLVSEGRRQARLRAIVKKADKVLVETYSEINSLSKNLLVDMAAIRARQAQRHLAAFLVDSIGFDIGKSTLPTRSQLRAIVNHTPVRGAVIGEWWRRQRVGTRAAFRTQLQIGMTQGEGISEMVRRIRGRSIGGGRFSGGVMGASTKQASALVRTSVTSISAHASIDALARNSRITEEYEYVATLDERTTLICINLDGNEYRYDDRKRRLPPQHWNCRSTIIPVIRWRALGLKPPTDFKRKTYPEWFAEQPPSVQDRILGRSRAKLIRDGKATLSDMIRRDGSRVTLEELAAA